MRPKWWNTNTVYYPIVLGSEIWMSCYEIGDGWASEWKAEIAGNLLPACLPASSTTLLHPIPSPYPTFYIPEALIQTRFVNIDVRSALRSCKFSLSPFYPFLMPSLSIFAFVPTSFFPLDRRLARLLHSDLPRGNRSWSDGSFSLTRITGEVSLPGSCRVINSFGSPSSASYPTLPQRTSCYHPFSGGERSHDKFQRSR